MYIIIASEASFLVCSMHGFSIYIYIYIYIYISGRTSCRKCSKCFYVDLNIRPMRYSARIESVGNARPQQLRTARQLRTAQSPNERDARLQQLRTARQLRTAQSPKERDARLQQLRTAREQTIATESTEERQTRLQQLRSAQQQRIAAGLVNGAMGTVEAICYRTGGPPDLPIAVMVHFDSYSGPTLHDGTVPITPLCRSWSSSGVQCSRLQLPLKLAWAVTIHKSQGLTLDKVVIDVGKREFSTGLSFVACSRVRRLQDLLFSPPFPFQRLSSLANSCRLKERQQEGKRLLSLQEPLAQPPSVPVQLFSAIFLDHIHSSTSMDTS